MHEGLGDDMDFARKFDREARAAARLSHPTSWPSSDQGEHRGRPFIVMEYVEGRTLRQVIATQAPLSPEKASPTSSRSSKRWRPRTRSDSSIAT